MQCYLCSLLVSPADVNARNPLFRAGNEVAVRAGLAGKAVPRVPADSHHVPLREGLGDETLPALDHLFHTHTERRGLGLARFVWRFRPRGY